MSDETNQPPIVVESIALAPLTQSPKNDMQKTFDNYKRQLADMESTIYLGDPSELTDRLHRLLREAIGKIRDLPQETIQPTSTEYFKSKDDVLENLRQARIQVMMAINSLTPPILQSILDQRKQETFYQRLLSSREYLSIGN